MPDMLFFVYREVRKAIQKLVGDIWGKDVVNVKGEDERGERERERKKTRRVESPRDEREGS